MENSVNVLIFYREDINRLLPCGARKFIKSAFNDLTLDPVNVSVITRSMKMFLSWWYHLLTILSISAISVAINRPVNKIVLNSKGYAQFIQYDVDVPTLREFTLCVWVRVTSLESAQSIFTYVGSDDKRIMRLWLDEGGRQLRISLGRDRVTSSAEVEFAAGAWRDVCLSYQADHGAWALYLDAALVLCEGSPKLRGVGFPGEGSLIFGYGTSEKGFPTGLSGEIYDASMILISTIERNITMRMDQSSIKQKPDGKNKITANNKQASQYIVLGDLQTDGDEIHDGTETPLTINKEYEIFPSDLTIQLLRNNRKLFSRHPSYVSASNEMNHGDFSVDDYHRVNEKDTKKYLNKNDTFKVEHEFKTGLTGSGTQDLPIVLEYETPPPITASTADYSNTNSEKRNVLSENRHEVMVISDVEKPPPPDHNPKVYGQWTSSKFVSNVLNYLKSIDFNSNKKQKKVPSTFPKGKLSDSYPYPSGFTYNIIRPPINYKKRTGGHHSIMKRNIKRQQINVQVIKPDGSDMVFSPYQLPDPKLVEVTNRGEAKRELKNKLHRIPEDNSSFGSEELEEPNISYNSLKTRQLNSAINAMERHRGSNLLEILPYIKSKAYFGNNEHSQTKLNETNQLYSRSLSSNNKWHNVKFYNNGYEPNVESTSNQISAVDMAKKKLTLYATRTKPTLNKQTQVSNSESIMIGRALAKEVSNQAKQNIYNVPLFKFKYNVLPEYDPKTTPSNTVTDSVINDYENIGTNSHNNFNKQVKLGNALNEQFITGFNEHQIKNTFLGGNDNIPDINRHRSKWSSKVEDIPASLQTRVCNNIELYVHEDETIGTSKFKSPVQRRNLALEMIVQSYKKCSMKESTLKGSSLMVIEWTKTPVKLFGGAYVKKTKDLCGFF